MFDTVLIANRGEIAVRVIRTLDALGIRSVAVHSDADAGARHVVEADHAVRLGPAPAAQSYLDIDRVVAAAVAVGADAVHPGYGFLSENAAFAEACAAHGIVFIGPPPSAMVTMGDKVQARRAVAAAGVAVVPGVDRPGLTDAELAEAALDIGLPVMVKAASGGGGKGMRMITDAATLAADIASARREAANAFGDDTLFVERFVTDPRHIEVQIAADDFGAVVHLGERECSLQRRHQKIIEESPSPFISPEVRERMGAQAIEAARACAYRNVGTVELITSGRDSNEFFFMEMNTRLQVEHPVTELVYGVDLVEAQLRIAAGEPLPWSQQDLVPRGHAVEARVYAEDPDRGFLPTGGTVLSLHEPEGPGVRVDSGLRTGTVVGSSYDPMLSKVIAFGDDRATALRRLDRALGATTVLGVTTNIGFLRALLADDDVRAGRLDTGLVERAGHLVDASPTPDAVVVTAALTALVPSADAAGASADAGPSEVPGRGSDPWQGRHGWRLGRPAWITLLVSTTDRGEVAVAARSTPHGWEVALDGGDPIAAGLERRGEIATVTLDGITTSSVVHEAGATVWLGAGGRTWQVERRSRSREGAAGPDLTSGWQVRSPMPGVVVTVAATAGDRVTARQTLAVVEAMKMEHTLVAPADGTVVQVLVQPGQQVTMDEVIAIAEPTGAEPTGGAAP